MDTPAPRPRETITVTYQPGKGFKKCVGTYLHPDGKPRPKIWWLGHHEKRAVEAADLILFGHRRFVAEGMTDEIRNPCYDNTRFRELPDWDGSQCSIASRHMRAAARTRRKWSVDVLIDGRPFDITRDQRPVVAGVQMPAVFRIASARRAASLRSLADRH